jgi:hypothetical protein
MDGPFNSVWICIFNTLYESIWWISPLSLLLSISERLTLCDLRCNPLQRPTPIWAWETSCGLALPRDPHGIYLENPDAAKVIVSPSFDDNSGEPDMFESGFVIVKKLI